VTHAKLPPGPAASMLTQLVRSSSDPYAYFERCKEEFGDIFTIKIPGQPPTVVVADPAAVRTLVSAGYDDLTRFADALRFMLGDRAVIFQQGQEHKETRKLMAPPFHGDRMRAYGAEMARASDEVFSTWQDGEERVLHRDFQDISLRVIVRCIFGNADASRLVDLERYFVEYVEAMLSPLLFSASLVLSGPRVRAMLRKLGVRARRAGHALSDLPLLKTAERLGAIDRILYEEIARCRALSEEDLAKRTDLLAMLVAAKFDDGSRLADETLRDQLMILLIGGHETTGTTLSWAIDCALRHPGTLERMRDEVANVMGDQFDPTKIKQLAYVGAVLNESMRLHPIATAVPRVLKSETTICGYTLPAGTPVYPSVYLIQRDPRLWPDEPTAFRPERFLENKKPSVYEFFPFGAGVWRCLGAQFADYEMRVVLARMVARGEIESLAGSVARPTQRGVTISPSNGIPVRIRLAREAKQERAVA
jgi:cytochrome P450